MTGIVRAALAAALLAAFASAAPSAAQQQPARIASVPAEKFLIAPGGVDMRTGRYAYSETDLAAGGGGPGALVLTRILPEAVGNHANPFGNFSHNWDIFLIETPSLAPGDDRIRVNVHQGGRSLTFETLASVDAGYAFKSDGQLADLSYSGDKKGGSAIHTLRGPDGTVLVFRPIGGADCADQIWGSTRRRCAFASRMTEADGTTYSFDYVATGRATGNRFRLGRVTSSRGYALLLQGSGTRVDKACLFNLALGPAPDAGAACPPEAPAAAAYFYAGDRLAKVASPGGAVSGFAYPTADEMAFVKPGQARPWLTNMLGRMMDEEGALQEIVLSQAFADGQAYAYAYGTAPITDDSLAAPLPTANPTPSIAGGSYKDSEGRETIVRFGFPLAPASGPIERCIGGGCSFEPPADSFASWIYQQTAGPVEIVDPLGRTTSINYCNENVTGGCEVGRMNASTDPEGMRTRYEYDGRGNIRKATRYPKPGVVDPDGTIPAPIVVEAAYDTANPKSQTKPLWTRDGNGNVTRYAYSPDHGGLIAETGPAVNGVTPQKRYHYVQRVAVTHGWEWAGPPVWLPDRMSFCRAGNPHPSGTGCSLGAGDEVVTSWDYGPTSGPNNLLLRGQAVTADGTTLRTCYGYDRLGRRISETSPNGALGLASCPAEPPAEALPYMSSTRYDADGQVTGTIAPDPDGAGGNGAPAVRNSYDPAGRLVKVEQGALAAWQSEAVAPASWTGFTVHRVVDTEYDSLDRKLKESVSGFPAGGGAPVVRAVTEYSYDRHGRLLCTAVRMNPDEFALPPRNACLQGTPHPAHGFDRISRNVYDDAGQPVEAWDGVGTSLERREAAWTYDRNGRKTSLTDARGFRAEMTYDGHGRQLRWIFPSRTTPGVADAGDYEEYRYDRNDNRTWLRKRDGSQLTFRYDALNRMTAKFVPERADLTAAQTRDVFYDYDLRGLQTKAKFDGLAGPGITNAYDGFGRLVSTWTDMDGTSRRLSSQYDGDGNRIVLWDNGVSYSGQYGYDRLGRMTHYLEGFGPVAFRLSYDPAGRRSSVALGVGSISSSMSYAYDEAGRLKTLARDLAGNRHQLLSFAHNPASQIVSRTGSNDLYAITRPRGFDRPHVANGLNQYMSAGPATFDYDLNGNLVSVVNPPDSANYVYDVENRLVAASGAQNAALAYDPLGRLWEISGPSGTTRFLYDGDDLIQEYDGNGNLLRDYDHGSGADEPLIWHEYAGGFSRRFLHADHQGSIVAVTDTDGKAIAINRYDEYGIPGFGNQGRFQYTGQTWLPELGLYHYKARIYSPTLGRFLQVDPIGYDDQINLYAYVGNDPVNGTDPSGKACQRGDGGLCGFARDFFVGDIEDAVAKPTPITIGVAVVTTAFKPAKIVDKVVDGIQALRRARLAQNVAKGARGEAATAKKLGDNVAGREVTFRNSDGTRTRVDFVTKDKGVVETKTGGSRLTPNQRKLHDDINAGREVTPVGRNASDAGLRSGKPTQMKYCSVDRPC